MPPRELDDEDAPTIVIGGQSFQNWLEFECDADLMIPADGWSLVGALPSSESLALFREGAKCDIYIGRDRQMSGVIDEVTITGTYENTRLRLRGRDKGAYLVDCEAPSFKLGKMTVKQLIEKLLDPSYGIKRVITNNDANRKLMRGKQEKKEARAKAKAAEAGEVPRASMKIDPGQTIASIIDQHTARLEIVWWMTVEGDIFIGKPNYNQDVAYYFRCAALGDRKATSNNVEAWTVTRSIAYRYSEIQVNGMGLSPNKADTWDTSKSAPKYKATARDSDLTARGIVRKTIIRDTDIMSGAEASRRANLELGKRQVEGLTISLTVPGFRDRETRRLYAPDTLASVKIAEAGIDGTYYVTQRRFKEDAGKRRTEITLKEKGVWMP